MKLLVAELNILSQSCKFKIKMFPTPKDIKVGNLLDILIEDFHLEQVVRMDNDKITLILEDDWRCFYWQENIHFRNEEDLLLFKMKI